jgi:hypothetical protein
MSGLEGRKGAFRPLPAIFILYLEDYYKAYREMHTFLAHDFRIMS